MGYNMTVTVLDDTTLADLASLGVQPVGAPIHSDHATSLDFDGIGAIQRGERLVLLASSLELTTTAPEWIARLGRTGATATWGSTADTYVWQVDGPATHRLLVVAGFEVVQEEGAPLPEEAQVEVSWEDDPEDWLFSLLEQRTGYALDPWELAQPLGGLQ